MLPHPIIQQLRTLNLDGMALALHEQHEQPASRDLSFEERLTLLLERERSCRDTRGLQRRLAAAQLKVSASLETVNTRHPRGLDAKLLRTLGEGQWIADRRGVISSTGATPPLLRVSAGLPSGPMWAPSNSQDRSGASPANRPTFHPDANVAVHHAAADIEAGILTALHTFADAQRPGDGFEAGARLHRRHPTGPRAAAPVHPAERADALTLQPAPPPSPAPRPTNGE